MAAQHATSHAGTHQGTTWARAPPDCDRGAPFHGFRELPRAQLFPLSAPDAGGWCRVPEACGVSALTLMIPFLALPIAYLLGAIPFGYLLVKLRTGADVRES